MESAVHDGNTGDFHRLSHSHTEPHIQPNPTNNTQPIKPASFFTRRRSEKNPPNTLKPFSNINAENAPLESKKIVQDSNNLTKEKVVLKSTNLVVLKPHSPKDAKDVPDSNNLRIKEKVILKSQLPMDEVPSKTIGNTNKGLSSQDSASAQRNEAVEKQDSNNLNKSQDVLESRKSHVAGDTKGVQDSNTNLKEKIDLKSQLPEESVPSKPTIKNTNKDVKGLALPKSTAVQSKEADNKTDQTKQNAEPDPKANKLVDTLMKIFKF